MKGGGGALGDQGGEFLLDLGHARVPVVDLESIGDGAAFALPPVGHDLPAERRCEEDEGGEPVDVVLHDGVAHLDEPHQLGVDASMGWDLRRAEAGKALLLLGVEPVRDDLTDVEPQQLRGDRRHDDLVGPIGISHPPLGHSQAVLAEKETVDAGECEGILQDRGVECGSTVAEQGGGGENHGRLDVLDAGQSGDLLRGRRGVIGASAVVEASEDRHVEVGRVGAGQIRGERRLRPPGRGQGTHGDAAYQPHQQDDGEIAGAAMAEVGSEPVPGDSKVVSGHAFAPPVS